MIVGSYRLGCEFGELPYSKNVDILELNYEYYEILQWRKWLDWRDEILQYFEDIKQPNPKMLNSPYLFNRWLEYAKKEQKKKASGEKMKPLFDELDDYNYIDDTKEEWEIEMGDKVWIVEEIENA